MQSNSAGTIKTVPVQAHKKAAAIRQIRQATC